MEEPYKTIYKHIGRLVAQHSTKQFSDTAFHMFLQETYCPILGYTMERLDPLTTMPLCPADPAYN